MKKAEGGILTAVTTIIIALLVLVLFLNLFGINISNLSQLLTNCKGYCVEDQADCKSQVTYESRWCEKATKDQGNVKKYCCEDLTYKGDPAGRMPWEDDIRIDPRENVDPRLYLEKSDGTVIKGSARLQPLDFRSDDDDYIIVAFNDETNAGDCIVYFYDDDTQEKIEVINGKEEIRFPCKNKQKVITQFQNNEFWSRLSLKMVLKVLKKGAIEDNEKNGLRAFAWPVELDLLGPVNLMQCKDMSFEVEFGQDFEEIDLSEYIENFGPGTLEYGEIRPMEGSSKITVEQPYPINYFLAVDYDKSRPGSFYRTFEIDVSIKEKPEQKQTCSLYLQVNYDAETQCPDLNNKQSECIALGCEYDLSTGQCSAPESLGYCEDMDYAECLTQVNICVWDNEVSKCIDANDPASKCKARNNKQDLCVAAGCSYDSTTGECTIGTPTQYCGRINVPTECNAQGGICVWIDALGCISQ